LVVRSNSWAPIRYSVRALRVLGTTVRVVVVLATVEVLIRWVTLPRLSRLLGVRLDWSPPRSEAERVRLRELPPRARRQVRCTHRVADIWPFSKGPCLRRALVAGHLLRRHAPAIRVGVAGTGEELHAHAWLEIDGRPLESVTEFSVFQRAPIGASQ
jgi:hypothetical protein